MADKNAMLMDRDSGMKYRDIAQKHGVSYQYVQQVCARYYPSKFQFITEEGCIFPNWRRWMNEERCSRYELLRRMGLATVGVNLANLRKYMSGKYYPRKPYIDKLLKATGLTYEELFAED